MDDYQRSKDELIAELVQLRKHNIELVLQLLENSQPLNHAVDQSAGPELQAPGSEADDAEIVRYYEQKCQQFSDMLHEGLVLTDSRGKIYYINKVMADWLGYRVEEVLGWSILDFVAREDQDSGRLRFQHRQALVDDYFDIKLRKNDGSYLWLAISSTPLNTSLDIYAGNIFIFLDITAQKQREQEYLQIIDSSSLGSFVSDLVKGETYYSAEWKKRLGIANLSAREAFRALDICVHPEDQEVIQKIWLEAIGNQVPKVKMEFRVRTMDSGYMWVLGQANIFYDSQGKPVKYIGSHMDISEAKRLEKALRDSEKKYRDLIETNVDFVWEIDCQGRYTYCSPQMENLWGIKPETMIGRTPFELIPAESRQRALEAFTLAANSPTGTIEFQTMSDDGRGNLVMIEVRGVPFFDDHGLFMGYRGTSRDITWRR